MEDDDKVLVFFHVCIYLYVEYSSPLLTCTALNLKASLTTDHMITKLINTTTSEKMGEAEQQQIKILLLSPAGCDRQSLLPVLPHTNMNELRQSTADLLI